MIQNDSSHILFIAPFPPPVHGSAMVSQQIRDSHVINNAFRCDYVNLSTSRRMDEIGKRSAVKLWRMVSAFIKTFWLLLTRRYALCYLAITCHGGGFMKDAPFVLLCKLFRRKIIIHQHNKGMDADVDRWPYRWLLPLVYKKAKVILLSWLLYPDIERVVLRENVVVCPNGIKVSNNVPLPKAENTVPHFLFLSNLIESKGVFVLLGALEILARKGQSFYCDFVGGETKEIDSERFTVEVNRRNLGRQVIYHGRKYGVEKDAFFQQSDVFVFPTYYGNECFPLVLLEAMAHQLPIVTTNEGGIPDVVQDGVNGIICERQNAQAVAAALERLANNSVLRYQMGAAGRKRLLEEFTEEMFLERMREILKG
ncbi:MAG: glycosyltransferase family 4 protein [Salinivirgaceae bacterium]|nr:glycosyltransferase family 4 protein [Salinivirgaceae bacterium]